VSFSGVNLQEDRFFDVNVVGTENVVSVGFDIASVRVHNPSGMWLLLPQNQQYIPPNTLGAYFSVKPTTKSLRIRYVDAPVGGQPSVVDGGPIQITVYANEVSDFSGLDYGLNALIQTLNANLIALTDALKINSPKQLSTSVPASASYSNVTLLAAPGAGKRYRVWAVTTSTRPAYPMEWQWFLILNGGTASADAYLTSNDIGVAPAIVAGVPGAENKEMRIRYRSEATTAGYDLYIAILYTIEDV